MAAVQEPFRDSQRRQCWMLRSGKRYKEDLADTGVAELLKAFMEESKRQEERREEDKRRYEEERRKEEERREEERKRYEADLLRREEAERRREEERAKEREDERRRLETLIRGVTEAGRKRIDVGPESLKLTKLSESEDVEAFLTAFERAVEAHGVERSKWAVLLAPQLSGKPYKRMRLWQTKRQEIIFRLKRLYFDGMT